MIIVSFRYTVHTTSVKYSEFSVPYLTFITFITLLTYYEVVVLPASVFIYTCITTVVDRMGGTNRWTCEFCEVVNFNVDTSDYEKPADDDVTYMLEPPPVVDKKKVKADEHNVIFVIDTSGSMSATEQVRVVSVW